MSRTLIGIVTRNDQENFQNCWSTVRNAIPGDADTIVVNDGQLYSSEVYEGVDINIQHNKTKNNAACYNEILRAAVKEGHEHIFLLWDIMEVKQFDVFYDYIHTSQKTGLPLLSYGLSSYPTPTGVQPNSRATIMYDTEIGVTLNMDTTSSFTYMHTSVVDAIGYFDERYKSVLELADFYYRAMEKGLVPAWGWFPDVIGSNEKVILNKSNDKQEQLRARIMHAAALFLHKFSVLPEKIPQLPIESVKETLKIIKEKNLVST